MMRRTIIDIGTNTILMLIADFDTPTSEVITILDIQRIPRLGKGVDKSRNILPESIEKAISILNEYKEISLKHESNIIIATATSFIRDSANRDEFIRAVKERTRIDIEVLSGKDEARWTFFGGIYDKLRNSDIGFRICTIDIGGGSTEITTGSIPSQFTIELLQNIKLSGQSFDIGSVRIKEKFFSSHPPSKDEIKLAEDIILSHLNQVGKSDEFDKSNKLRLIGVAGTITTLGAIKLGLDKFIPEKVDDLEMTIEDITKLLEMLSSKSLEELYSMGNYMEGRADIIIPGTLILKCFMEKFGLDKLTISTKGLRYGMFLREVLK